MVKKPRDKSYFLQGVLVCEVGRPVITHWDDKMRYVSNMEKTTPCSALEIKKWPIARINNAMEGSARRGRSDWHQSRVVLFVKAAGVV